MHKPKPYKNLGTRHGQMDNVPGNSYGVKGSGFPALGHAENLRVFPGLAPKAQKHKISLTKRKILRAGTAVIENVFIQQRIQLIDVDIEVSGGLEFRIELLHWFQRSGHSVLFRIPC